MPSDNEKPLIGEFGLIDWIRRQAQSAGPWTDLGIGDDCAILGIRDRTELLVTTDMLMDGRHFRLEDAGAEAVGYKAMGVNLSDIAAMAGIPRAAVVSVALPRDRAAEIARGLYAGMRRLADRYQVDLVGGDTNAWDGPLVINITLLGEASPRGAVRRSGAVAGDAIFVTGPLGGSLASGRHLRPNPRIDEALALHQFCDLHAMIDLSDGLASDLSHILEESGGLGAILNSSAVPIHEDALGTSDGRNSLEHALADGEDFELCLTVSERDAPRLERSPPPGTRLYRIGEITGEKGIWLRGSDGKLSAISARGFDHLLASP